MHTSDASPLTSGMEPPAKGRRISRPAAELLAELSGVLASGDQKRAALLVAEAGQDHPGYPLLASAVARCKAMVNRAAWLEESLQAMRQNLEEDRYSDAFGHLRQALTLTLGVGPLREVAVREAVRQAEDLLPANWRIAEAILRETAAVDGSFLVDAELQAKVTKARADEALTLAIYRADRTRLEGRKEQARQALASLLASHPEDSRILERLEALGCPEGEPAVTPLVAKVPASVAVARPVEQDLDTEGTPNDLVQPQPKTGSTRVVMSSQTWNAAKNFAYLAGSTAMLAAACVLVWQHFSKAPPVTAVRIQMARVQPPPAAAPAPAPAVEPAAVPEPVAEKIIPEDEQAWNLVKTSQNAADIHAFLVAYPTSPHVVRARIKLASLAWERADKTSAKAMDRYLRTYPLSPYRQEAQRLKLVALARSSSASARPPNSDEPQAVPNDRQVILGLIRSDQTQAGQFDEPVISGDEATVQFHPAGAANPATETITLVKEDGSWKIQSVH